MKTVFYTLLIILFFSFGAVSAQGYRTHEVKEGETISTIAKIYNVTVEAIYRLNPDVKTAIKPNTTLLIPEPLLDTPKDKVILGKKIESFKRHKVRRKETLYSLSKRYGIFIEDLKKHNEFLYANTLKKGDVLKIPVYSHVRTVVKAKTKKYVVRPKEGKWRIAYKHGISVPELEALNPELGEVLQAGQIINVPNLDGKLLQPIDENQYNYYTVLPKEGFYRLKVKLGVEQDELERLNPKLKSSGLKEGMVLKVPLSSRFVSSMDTVSTAKDTLAMSTAAIEMPVVDLSTRDVSKESKHIAIMLPFKAQSVVVEDKSEAKKKISKDPYMSRSLDFYSGVLMALKSLKELGVHLEVDVYDTENKTSKIQEIFSTADITSLDAVIGPLMPKLFNTAAIVLQGYNTPIVSPITKKVNMGRNVFQSRPKTELLENKIINYFKKDTVNQHIVVISDSKNETVSKKLKEHFPNAEMVSSKKDPTTKKDKFYIIDEDLIDLLKPGKNIVFLETENTGFISNVSSILNSLITEEVKITLATTNMSKAYDSEEVSNYHLSNLQLHFPTIARINNTNRNTFSRRYKKQYKVTPNTFAVRGYDLMLDIGLRLATCDNLYASVTEAPLTAYTENKFAYQKNGNGYQNNAVYMVKHSDLKLMEVKEE